MNFSVYMDDELYSQLKESSEELHMTRNSIIKTAFTEWLDHYQQSRWKKLVLQCRVGEDFPDVEKLRSELLPRREIEL